MQGERLSHTKDLWAKPLTYPPTSWCGAEIRRLLLGPKLLLATRCGAFGQASHSELTGGPRQDTGGHTSEARLWRQGRDPGTPAGPSSGPRPGHRRDKPRHRRGHRVTPGTPAGTPAGPWPGHLRIEPGHPLGPPGQKRGAGGTGHAFGASPGPPPGYRAQLRTCVTHNTNTEQDFPVGGIHKGLRTLTVGKARTTQAT